MGSISDSLETDLLDHVLNQVAYTPAATVYLALCTADPTDAGTGVSMSECADANGYARTAITFAVAASRAVDQTGAVTFPSASGGGWGTVSHWGIVSASVHGTGDLLAHGAFAASKVINDGDTPSVASGEIDVTFSAGEISDYLAEAILDFAFRNQAYTAPDTYAALCDTIISDSDTGITISEPAGGSYARELVDENGGASPTWDLASGTTPTLVDNTHEIAFTTATASWGNIKAVAICDALGTGTGNLLFYDNDMTDKDVGNGDTAKFPISALDITLA